MKTKSLLKAVLARSAAWVIAATLTGPATADALRSTQAPASVEIIKLQEAAEQLAKKIDFPSGFQKK